MNRHQVLTGAANPGDSCFAVGSVEGVHFTVRIQQTFCTISVKFLFHWLLTWTTVNFLAGLWRWVWHCDIGQWLSACSNHSRIYTWQCSCHLHFLFHRDRKGESFLLYVYITWLSYVGGVVVYIHVLYFL